MRVELGAPIVLVRGVPTLWHLPAGEPGGSDHEPTLCGLAGDAFVYRGAARRGRHCCHVCLRHGGAPRLHRSSEPEPPPRPPLDEGSSPRPWPPIVRLETSTTPPWA